MAEMHSLYTEIMCHVVENYRPVMLPLSTVHLFSLLDMPTFEEELNHLHGLGVSSSGYS